MVQGNARQGPPTLWHQCQLVENPLPLELNRRLVAKSRHSEVFSAANAAVGPRHVFVISSILTTINTRTIGSVLTLHRHFHLSPLDPLARKREGSVEGATCSVAQSKLGWSISPKWFLAGTTLRGWRPTPMTNLGGLCLELLSGKGLESAFLEGIGLKHETVLCHDGAVFPKTPMETRTVPWLHRLRLPPRGHLPNGHNGEQSVLSRFRVRCVSFSPLKSGNKSNTPPASTVAGQGFAGHCNPSS